MTIQAFAFSLECMLIMLIRKSVIFFQVTDKGEVDGEEDAFRNFSEIARNNQASTVKAESRNPDER